MVWRMWCLSNLEMRGNIQHGIVDVQVFHRPSVDETVRRLNMWIGSLDQWHRFHSDSTVGRWCVWMEVTLYRERSHIPPWESRKIVYKSGVWTWYMLVIFIVPWKLFHQSFSWSKLWGVVAGLTWQVTRAHSIPNRYALHIGHRSRVIGWTNPSYGKWLGKRIALDLCAAKIKSVMLYPTSSPNISTGSCYQLHTTN